MSHRTSTCTRSRTLALVLLFLLPAFARAEDPEPTPPTALPPALIETEDLQVHRFDSMCNMYFVTCVHTQAFVVVDPCPEVLAHVETHVANGHTLQAIWITHEHGDHVGGLGTLLAERRVPVVLHADAKRGIAEVREKWAEWGFTDAILPPPVLEDEPIADGAEVRVGRLAFRALHAPGHAPGSICFLLPDRLVLAGDVLFAGSVGRTDLPTSDPAVFARSLSEKLWALADAVVLLPGHMQESTIGREKKTNWLFQDLVRRARGEAPIPRPWLGIQIDSSYEGTGVRIESVVEGSPAAGAGLTARDVIKSLDGTSIAGIQDLVRILRSKGVGDELRLGWRRGQEPHEKTIALAAKPVEER